MSLVIAVATSGPYHVSHLMHQHASPQYVCPLCRVAAGSEREAVVYEDSEVIAALSLHQKANNVGSLLVFPRAHVENLYVASPSLVSGLFVVAQKWSRALKRALSADGVTLIQNNEPAGGQDVWHLHVHVVPRYKEDAFYSRRGEAMSLEERGQLADKIRVALTEPPVPNPSIERTSSGKPEFAAHVER